jgi:hypothetical protein
MLTMKEGLQKEMNYHRLSDAIRRLTNELVSAAKGIEQWRINQNIKFVIENLEIFLVENKTESIN